MKKLNIVASGTVVLASLAAAPALAAGSGARVSVRVEGLDGTVMAARTVSVPTSGSVDRFGAPAGGCPADSAQGALDNASGGSWKGSWDAAYREYYITGIDGYTPNAKSDYFEIFVNDVAASSGTCAIKLRTGDRLLFAAVPDKGTEYPLGVSATVRGTTVTAKVVAYDARGRATALRGATVRLGSSAARTNAAGIATLKAPARSATLVASRTGDIQDETTVPAR